ncbi:MAG: glycoside hydrolase family 95 protein [Clostridia bacterium]|nr:glycoside hydrolase family 95 protein [Clostridia bacterium]
MNGLFYLQPATTFNQALFSGNGRLGCVAFGGAPSERLVLNEESLWSGKKRDRINPACKSQLDEVRRLIFEGKVAEAQELAHRAIVATPPTQRRYKAMCDITLNLSHSGEITDYTRSLDLDKAVITTSYNCGGTLYKREVFTSHPADCVVVRLTAENGKLEFVAGGKVRGGFESVRSLGNASAAFFGGEGIKFACVMRVVHCDGEVSSMGGDICVRGATYATLLISAVTDWKHKNFFEKACAILDTQKSYKDLLEEHINDYSKLYSRVSLNLGGEDKSGVPTDVRLSEFARGGVDNGLIALYFNFGRYLLISCSRAGGLPANLQGIWNEDPLPCWDSKYTININLQMNYWHANICGLEECCEPFFSLLQRVRKSGKKTADKMYGCKGFVAHHNTDINADTAPQDKYVPATCWTLGGAWLALHIYDFYRFTGDTSFLRKNYCVLKDAVLFFKDFLIENKDGYLVACPSLSPENSYVDGNKDKVSLCAGSTSDTAILTQLFSDFISAASLLNKDKKLAEESKLILKKLPPLKISRDGRIMEWLEEYDEVDKGHRHMSHLIGLFPANLITVENTPELAEAAKKSLDYRLAHGGGGTGWSRAWVVCLKDRLKDGDGAYENLRELISKSTFPNLTDGHPRPTGGIFQIDGNFGGTCGIAEMLLQSYDNKLFILPALPKELPYGEVKGLRARGGIVCDIKWNEGKAEHITFHALRDTEIAIVYNSKSFRKTFTKGETISLDGELGSI